jgi:enoyl-CoA hydratase/carnithine racemase
VTTTQDIPQWEHIAATREEDVLELRVHTDGAQMVWGADPHRELTEAFRWVAASPDLKVVILTGTGSAFCTEIDTSGFAAMPWHEIWWEGRKMLTSLHDIDVPVIAVANGPATIHSELLVMGDVVLAAEHAEFADHAHFATRDTVPGDGVAVVWGELLGPTRTKYFLLTGQVIPAAEALSLGVVNEVLPGDQVLTRAWELARDLARRSLPVLRYSKAAIGAGWRRDFDERISHGLGVQGSGHWSLGGVRSGTYATTETPGTTED